MDPRFASFLLLSALTHGALIGWKDNATVQPPRIGGQAQALRVVVAPGARSTVTPQATAAFRNPVQPHAARDDTASTPQRQPGTAKGPRRVAPRPAQQALAVDSPRTEGPPALNTAPAQHRPAAHDAGAGHSDAQQVGQRISAALQQELAKQFEYPWIARKRGWQGRVTLSLQIHENGDLTDWKVSQTSGHTVLDRSALDCARRIDRLPEAARWLDGRSLELMIPVQYRLRDS